MHGFVYLVGVSLDRTCATTFAMSLSFFIWKTIADMLQGDRNVRYRPLSFGRAVERRMMKHLLFFVFLFFLL